MRKAPFRQSQAFEQPQEPIGTDDLAQESFNLVKSSSKYGHIDDSFIKKFKAGGLQPPSTSRRLY